MKTCNKCKVEKSLELFSKRRREKDGLQRSCKTCYNAYKRAYRKANIEAELEYGKTYREANRERIAIYNKAWTEANRDKAAAGKRKWSRENPEKVAACTKAYRTANAGKVNALTAKRRAAKIQRTPSWACLDNIKEFYTCAKELEELTGIEFHVDHIVPLLGKFVSGLHVALNLQILTAHDNICKNNSFEVG